MTEPRIRTVEAFIAGLTLLTNYMEEGLQTPYFCVAEHEIIYIRVDLDKLPEASASGRQLRALGFHATEDGWCYFT